MRLISVRAHNHDVEERLPLLLLENERKLRGRSLRLTRTLLPIGTPSLLSLLLDSPPPLRPLATGVPYFQPARELRLDIKELV